MRARLVAAILLGAAARAPAQPEPPARTAPEPEPDDYERLGSLERIEVDAVLAEQHRTVDRAPGGKTIRQIVIATRPVFSDADGFLTAFNVFHVTTKDEVIRREILFAPGDPWDPSLVDETLRNLRDPLFHNVLVILPLVTEAPDQVDALVVVRDVWSLRVSTRYEVQNLDLLSLYISLAETNFLGLRKRLSMLFTMDQGSIEIGPSYYDPNIAGTHATLTSFAHIILSRAGGDLEGTDSDTTLAYPFWSLRERWSASLHVAHYVGFFRSFLGSALRRYDDPDTPVVEAVPWIYKRRELAAQAEVLRGFGSSVIQRVGIGYSLAVSRPALVDDFPDDPTLRAAFTRDVLPRSEISSGPFLHWLLFTPVWGAYRDIDTFDFREDYQLGPMLEAKATANLAALGSDVDHLDVAATATESFAWAGGLYRFGAGFSGRLGDAGLVDRKAQVAIFVASPVVGSAFRVLAALNLDWLTDETNNRFFTLGGDTGLRGYQVGAFAGLARAVAHVEARTRPLRLAFLRIGAVAFWDGGDAGPALADLNWKHDAGGGLRIVVPQLDQIVIRFDWAFPFAGPVPSWPGRVSLGVYQVF
jgi:hypothetical protein